MTDDGFYNGMPPCELGTDCSDCGVNVSALTVMADFLSTEWCVTAYIRWMSLRST